MKTSKVVLISAATTIVGAMLVQRAKIKVPGYSR